MDLTARIGTHGIINVTAQRAEIAALSWDHIAMINNENKNYNNEIEGRKEGNGTENPFVRKSVIMRSPPAAVSPRVVDSTNILAYIANPSISNVMKLGEKISKLIDFLKTRSNVHKEITTMSREIQAVYMQLADDLDCATHNKDQINKETQTEEAEKQTEIQLATPKRKRDSNTLSPKGNKSKKKKSTIPNKIGKNSINTESGEASVPASSESDSRPANPVWVEERSRNGTRRKPVRPDALVIRTSGDISYADILRQVKSDPKLSDLGQNVRNIRKTEKGELLLELNKSGHQNTSEFRLTVKEVLGSVAEVRALSQEILLEIRDIDEVTTNEDVYDALRNISEDFNTLEPHAIKNLRRAYGGTQIATISLSATLANRLLETAKIRIGWVVCRIREKLSPKRCYKCLDYGHKAMKCKGPDNSDKCIQCGETGHKIKTCTKKPSCMLCRCNESDDTSDHVTGCAVCPYYKKALQQLRPRK